MKAIRFNCNGFHAPAYGCSEPGDNSGEYVPAEVARGMLAACELIAAHDPETCDGITPRDCLDTVREIARAAIAAAKE